MNHPIVTIRSWLEQLEDRAVPATVETFDESVPLGQTKQYGVAPGPELVAGPTGKAMRLASATPNTIGSITYPLTDPGTFQRIEAKFSLRMIAGAGQPGGIGRADGIGVAFLSTAVTEYGTEKYVGGFSEEPNFAQSLGVGFDIYQSAGEPSNNTVSLHFDAKKLIDVDVPLGTLDLASGNFFDVQITARFGSSATGGDVTVQLGATTVMNQVAVPGLFPYQSRFHAMARSGGESAHQDIDSVNVQYIPPETPTISFAAATHTVVEAQPAIVLKAVRTGSTQAAASVTVNTANGTATAGSDFTGGPYILMFAAGKSEADITIPLVNDTVFEPTETMTATLSNPTNGATLGTLITTTVTINDDDPTNPPGEWSAPVALPVTAIHTVMLPNSKVMLWSRHDAGQHGTPHIFDLVKNTVSMTKDPGYDIFCAGHVVLPDGRVFVAGGHITDGAGEKKASIYDPQANTWVPVPDMNAGRWYPTVTLLPSGDVLVLGGTFKTNPNDKNEQPQMNTLPQVYEVKANKWRDLKTALTGNAPDWADYYPWAAVAPDGKVFVAGPQKTARFLDTNGTGKWTDAAASALLYRDYGSAVEYSDGKMLITGGNPRDNAIVPSASAQTIEMIAGATFQTVAPMTFGRRHHNLVLLPDGNVFVVGGSSTAGFQDLAGAVYTPEIWNPTTNIWTPQAKHAIPLLYHSNALLLPTGQVLVTGGGQPAPDNGTDQNFAQLFTPEYLLTGNPRPTITSAPGATKYNVPFTLQTSDPAAIDKLMLIPLPAPTHAFNENQGVSNLTFTRTVTGLTVNAPADAVASAPGYYYLFAVSDKGVPSIAHIIRLDPNAPLNTPPTISDIPNLSVVVGSIAFSVNDAETPINNLVVTATSSNTTLVPNASITLGGSGVNRTITVTPATGQTGTATITVIVTDGEGAAATDTFTVTFTAVGQLLVGGPPNGTAQVFTPTAGQFQPGPSPSFFPGSAVNVRTATGDVNGDGVADYIGGTGVGKATQVVVIDGKTGVTIATIDPFEAAFTGGVFVAAADINGDGKADVIVTPDKGGGPVVVIYDGASLTAGKTGEQAQHLRYFGIDDPGFRGGARATAGDMTGDGTPEVIVSAGFLGGPRITIWSGVSVRNRAPAQLQNFFAFEDTLRNGAFVAAGDMTRDGRVDLAYGGGPGGAPRVRIFDGVHQLSKGNIDRLDSIPDCQMANFFAGDSARRGGVRLAWDNVDGDALCDLVTGSGEGDPAEVRMYRATTLATYQTDPSPDQTMVVFGGISLTDGVFVGSSC